jgi:hypothetical protein
MRDMLTTFSVNTTVFWDVTLCNLVEGTKVMEAPAASIFRVKECLFFLFFTTPFYYEVEYSIFSETFVLIYQTSRNHLP